VLLMGGKRPYRMMALVHGRKQTTLRVSSPIKKKKKIGVLQHFWGSQPIRQQGLCKNGHF